jgi:hypothetical protein
MSLSAALARRLRGGKVRDFIVFPNFDRPPEGASVPTAREIQALGAHAALASVSHRATLMNAVGRAVGVPPGGWKHGQSRLFEDGDIRLVWLLRRLAHDSVAARVASNLSRAGHLIPGDLMLTLVTAARENGSGALSDLSMKKIDSWYSGGLDFLWADRGRLGLPKSVTDEWEKRKEFTSHETGNTVYPAKIPARDQILAYAAQIRLNYDLRFQGHLRTILGGGAGVSFVQASRIAKLVWKAYAFLAPGGTEYHPGSSVAAQSGQHFGCKTALQFLAHRDVIAPGDRADLNGILTLADFNHIEYVRSAKIRVTEALFLERMLTVTRELLPPAPN